jgi:phage tail-like protein
MNTDSSVEPAAWAPPEFHFQVQWDGMDMSFREVSGLDTGTESMEYRKRDAPGPRQTPNMSGIERFGTVSLKMGVFTADEKFYNFLNQIRTDSVKCLPMTISLIDGSKNENNSAVMRWTLSDARPCRLTGSDLKSDGREVAVESMEVVHTGITVDKD